MARVVSEAERSRSKNLSLTAEQFFIIEEMNRAGVNAAQVYRRAINEAAREHGINAYIIVDGKRQQTKEFKEFLDKQGWSNERINTIGPYRKRG